MPLDVLKSWPDLVSVVSGFAGILGFFLSLRGRQSVRLGAGWGLALFGFLTTAGAVVSLAGQHAPLLSAGSAVRGGIAVFGVLLCGVGVSIVARTRAPNHQMLKAIASIVHGLTYPPDPTGRVHETVELDAVGRRRSRLRRLGRRPPGKLVILTGPAGTGKTVGLRSIVTAVCERAERRPRRLALYVDVRAEDLPDGRIDEDTIKDHLTASVPGKADNLAQYLEQAPAQPSWLFVFDLDEGLTPSQAEQYVQAVRSFVISRDDCAIVATRNSVPKSSAFAMAPLTSKQQRQLLSATGHTHPGVLRWLRHDPRISDIAGNPLLLSLLGISLTRDELRATRHQVLDEIITTLLRRDTDVADASQLAYLAIDEPSKAAPDIQIAETLTHPGLGRTSATGFRFAHEAIHHHLAGKHLCQIAATVDVDPLLDDPRWHPVVVAALRGGCGALREKVVASVRTRLALDIGSMEHVVTSVEALAGDGDLPTPGSFNWPPASLASLTLLRDGLLDETADQRANAVMVEADTLVLTAIAAGANRDRADAIELLPLTSCEVAAAVTDYVIQLEDETGLTDRLVTQLAASPAIYQGLSGANQIRMLRASTKPHRLNHVLYGVAQNASASSLPGRMRWMLRIGQMMALGVIGLLVRMAVNAPRPSGLVFAACIAAPAVTFLLLSAMPHSAGGSRIARYCGVAVVWVVSLLAAFGGLGAALSLIGEIITGQVPAAAGSVLWLWLFTWAPAMVLHAATAPSDTAPRLLLLPQFRVLRNPMVRPALDEVRLVLRRARSTPVRALFFVVALAGIVFFAVTPHLWSDKDTVESIASALVLVIGIACLIAARPSTPNVPRTGSRSERAADPLDVFRVDGGSDAIKKGLGRLSTNVDSLRMSEHLLSNLDSVLEFIKETMPKQMEEPIKPRVWMLMPKEQVPGLYSLLREYDNRNPGKLTMRAHSSRERQEINTLRGQGRSKEG
ncbi:NACHT domain-containing protein [Amycolatopsis sp. TRM77291]